VLIALFSVLCDTISNAFILGTKLKSAIDVLSVTQNFDHWISTFGFIGTIMTVSALNLVTFRSNPTALTCASSNPCSCDFNQKFSEFCHLEEMMWANQTIDSYYEVKKTGSVAYFEKLLLLLIVFVGFVLVLSLLKLTHWKYKNYLANVELQRLDNAVAQKKISGRQSELIKQIMVKQMSHNDKGGSPSNGKKDALSRLQILANGATTTERNIGQGAFGDVHKAKYNGVTVAVKTLSKVEEDTMQNFKVSER